MIIFKILPFLFLAPLSKSLRCFNPLRPPLPIPSHCQHLANALAYAAVLPRGSDEKDWGRRLPNTAFTEKLPKLYWINGLGPTTCALQLDVVAGDYLSVETFSLKDVAITTEKIVRVCLFGRSQVGYELLGETEHVEARLIRTDVTGLQDLESSRLERMHLGSGVELLAMSFNASKPAMDGAVVQRLLNASHPISGSVEDL